MDAETIAEGWEQRFNQAMAPLRITDPEVWRALYLLRELSRFDTLRGYQLVEGYARVADDPADAPTPAPLADRVDALEAKLAESVNREARLVRVVSKLVAQVSALAENAELPALESFLDASTTRPPLVVVVPDSDSPIQEGK